MSLLDARHERHQELPVILSKCRSCLALAVIIATSGVGCAGNGAYVWVDSVPESTVVARPSSQVAIGDIVNVRVFGQEAMNVRAPVRLEGTLTMPLIGDVRVVGRLPAEISKEVETRLQPFINAPRVTTVIDESHLRVVMAGEVRRPGSLALNGSVDLLTAIADAGGLTEFAGNSDIYVIRTTPAGIERIRFRWDDVARGVGKAARFRLRDKDSVVVE